MLGLWQDFKRLDQGRREGGLYLRIETIYQAGGGNPTGAISQKERRLGISEDEPYREERPVGKISSLLLADYSNPKVKERQLTTVYEGTIR